MTTKKKDKLNEMPYTYYYKYIININVILCTIDFFSVLDNVRLDSRVEPTKCHLLFLILIFFINYNHRN